MANPADEVKPHLDALLSKGEYTVRDGMLTLLAMEVEHGDLIDWREQGLHNPARSASKYLGSTIYPRLHIAGSPEALQTGVKGVRRYIDRKNATWKAILEWASQPVLDAEWILADVARQYNLTVDELRRGSRANLTEARFVVNRAGGGDLLLPAEVEQDSDDRPTGDDEEVWYTIGDATRQACHEAFGITHIEAAFHYLAAGIAATARNLPAMPALDTPKLTFPAIFALLDDMLRQNSAGAHEQFIFAALLEGWREQLGEPGVVETKNLNASDSSAGTAADVQEKHRGQVTEAYEVTANDYTTKIDQAKNTLRRHDLRRAHILARDAAKATGEEIADALPPGLDLAVLDVREEVRSILAQLGKPHRRFALERLYRLLVDKQANDQLVQDFVSALAARGLTEMS
ncbi:MAG TPA: hypothetical protein VFP17_10940 [Solirubrobacterales bacterium]|nr:hypothetical protein [Solirubrobacterales bacterium]